MLSSFFKHLFGLRKPVSGPASAPLDELALLLAANAAIDKNDLTAAAQVLEPLTNSDSKNPDIYVTYGYVLLDLKEYVKAKTVLQAATALAPESADAHYILGKACMGLQEPDAAEQAWATCYVPIGSNASTVWRRKLVNGLGVLSITPTTLSFPI